MSTSEGSPPAGLIGTSMTEVHDAAKAVADFSQSWAASCADLPETIQRLLAANAGVPFFRTLVAFFAQQAAANRQVAAHLDDESVKLERTARRFEQTEEESQTDIASLPVDGWVPTWRRG